ncbi:hypothetical protein HDU83_009774 [Entophlyctis luteolus]|nr:hypothetical protein HDU83_009774 [Entophlyctis luteolus]
MLLLSCAKHPQVPSRVEHVVSYLKELQKIAQDNGGSRAVNGPGFNASVDFVVSFLRSNTNLNVWTEPFSITEQVDRNPASLSIKSSFASSSVTYEQRTDFLTATGSGSGNITDARLIIASGCDPAIDILPSDEPFVAIIPQTNSRKPSTECDNSLCSRVAYAITNGARAVLLTSTPTAIGYPRPLAPSGRLRCPTSLQPLFGTLPILSLGQSASWDAILRALDTSATPTVSLSADTLYTTINVVNVLADSVTGSDDSVVVFGSHLDSVRAGPGVNDDGSGAMATLELARAFSNVERKKKSVQKVRFAWWAAEEFGLLGSRYHVGALNATQLAQYKLTIDTDMIGSPNYVRGVWDGHGVTDPRIADACAAIARVFESHFARHRLPTTRFAFNGRSDFAPFMDAGVPAGGVVTGEDEIKTVEQAETFGGIAGMVLDPRYHQPADGVDSVRGPGLEVLTQNLDALAHALGLFAFEKHLDKLLKGSPNVDKPSMIRWKQAEVHRVRRERADKIAALRMETEFNKVLSDALALLNADNAAEMCADFAKRDQKIAHDVMVMAHRDRDARWQPPVADPFFIKRLDIPNMTSKIMETAKADGDLKALAAELVEALAVRNKEVAAEIVKEEAITNSKISSETIHEGFSRSMVTKQVAPATSPPEEPKKKKTVKKTTETEIITLNEPIAADSSKAASSAESDETEESDDVYISDPKIETFSKLVAPEASYNFISANPYILNEKYHDQILAEAFSVAMKGDFKRCKECVHQSLILQYCKLLGKDGVRLFFERLATPNHKAREAFTKDVNDTFKRISDRVAELKRQEKEEEEKEKEEGERRAQAALQPDGTYKMPISDNPSEDEKKRAEVFDQLPAALQSGKLLIDMDDTKFQPFF